MAPPAGASRPPPRLIPSAAAMAAPASPGRRSRFEQEQERAVRALVRSITGLHGGKEPPRDTGTEQEAETELERFQTALDFAWSNFRSAPSRWGGTGGEGGGQRAGLVLSLLSATASSYSPQIFAVTYSNITCSASLLQKHHMLAKILAARPAVSFSSSLL